MVCAQPVHVGWADGPGSGLVGLGVRVQAPAHTTCHRDPLLLLDSNALCRQEPGAPLRVVWLGIKKQMLHVTASGA